MVSSKIIFADRSLAERVARDLYPDAERITFVEHSYDNLVALVDQTYALRFPRNEAALLRSKYEEQVLRRLATIENTSIPRVLERYDTPPCLITSFLAGKHIKPSEIRTWPQSLQLELGEKIAHFAFQMHSLLSVDEARYLRKELKLDEQKEEPWEVYFKRLFETKLPDITQNVVAHEYYQEWKNLRTATPVVLHDDLHTENMLFEGQHLVGVLDFGDTNIGSPEQELRQLFRINETVLSSAVKTYEQLSGLTLNVRAVKVWAIMQELAVYIEHQSAGQYDHHAFIRASVNLNQWLASDIWGKGFIDTGVTSKQ